MTTKSKDIILPIFYVILFTRCVCETLSPWWQQRLKKPFLAQKVKVTVGHKSLTLATLERAFSVIYACKI